MKAIVCFVADVYLNIRYLFTDPDDSMVYHYMTLRNIVEIGEAAGQLVLQGYIGLRHCLFSLGVWKQAD